MLGCGLPGGEQGHNLGRIVAVQMGMDHLPGCTITRYCSSSLQTTRMALHAIKAGEGDVFISAGVETVSRSGQGQLRRHARHPQPALRRRRGPYRRPRRAGRRRLARPARGRRWSPTSYIAMGQTAENLARLKGVTRQDMDEFGVRSQNLAEKAIADGFWEREITPVTTAGRHGGRQGRRPARRRHPGGRGRASSRSSAPTAWSPRATAARSTTAPPPLVIMSDTKARELGLTPLARIVSTGVSGLSPEIMGYGPVEASKQALTPGRHVHRRHRPGRDQRGVRRPGHPLLPRPGHRPGPAQRQRRRHRRRPPLRHDGRPHHRRP